MFNRLSTALFSHFVFFLSEIQFIRFLAVFFTFSSLSFKITESNSGSSGASSLQGERVLKNIGHVNEELTKITGRLPATVRTEC
ncbi:MAG: hypothetical protein ACFFD4_11585 [Candidatus Odinarchaeota archaeon]